jgi:dihydroxy-acid dehydratase
MGDDQVKGLSRGLTNYGDKDFSVYLRNSFASSMGYSREVLKKPIVGIANSFPVSTTATGIFRNL